MKKVESQKKSFVLYCDIYNSIKDFTIDDKATLLDVMFCYSIDKNVPKMSPIAEVAFSFIKTILDRDEEKWNQIREVRREAGSKGGKQRVANQANATFALGKTKQIKQKQANQAVNVNVSDSVIVNKEEPNKDKTPRLDFTKLAAKSLEVKNLR